MFSEEEVSVLRRLFGATAHEDITYPFDLSDQDLEMAFKAIRRDRGDKMDEARRKIRLELARKMGWYSSISEDKLLDKATGGCEFIFGNSMFARLYQEYERMKLEELSKGEQS